MLSIAHLYSKPMRRGSRISVKILSYCLFTMSWDIISAVVCIGMLKLYTADIIMCVISLMCIFLYLTTLCDKYRAITTAKYLLPSVLQAYEKRNSCLNCYRSMKGNNNSPDSPCLPVQTKPFVSICQSVSHP
jgi:hypothetical protein